MNAAQDLKGCRLAICIRCFAHARTEQQVIHKNDCPTGRAANACSIDGLAPGCIGAAVERRGAPEIEELTFLRDQQRQLLVLISEIKAENRGLSARLELAAQRKKTAP